MIDTPAYNSYDRTRFYSYDENTMKFTLLFYIIEDNWVDANSTTSYSWMISYQYFKGQMYHMTQNYKTNSFEFETFSTLDWDSQLPDTITFFDNVTHVETTNP
jgi:hypothetical protein